MIAVLRHETNWILPLTSTPGCLARPSPSTAPARLGERHGSRPQAGSRSRQGCTMVDGLAIVEDEVRELIRRNGLDPATQLGEVRRLVDDVVRDYDERSLLGVLPALGELGLARRRIMDAVAGLGALQPLLDDPDVEEIWINAPHEVYCARGGTSELTSIRLPEAEIPALVERMLKSSGRRLDLSQPF